MCKGCKMDNREVKNFYARQGAVDVSDFDDEFKHVKSATKKARKRRRGCEGNEGGSHVYVWVPEKDVYSWTSYDAFFDFFGYNKSERQVCAGCNRRGKSRETVRYAIERDKWFYKNYRDASADYRGIAIPRGLVARMKVVPATYVNLYNWENNVPGYKEFLRKRTVIHSVSGIGPSQKGAPKPQYRHWFLPSR